jgi:hypothetical protein
VLLYACCYGVCRSTHVVVLCVVLPML